MAGFAPSIVAALGGLEPGGWVVISLFTAAIALIATASALTAKETYQVPTHLLGRTAHKVENAPGARAFCAAPMLYPYASPSFMFHQRSGPLPRLKNIG